MSEHDFKGAIKFLDDNGQNFEREEWEAIQACYAALRIADRLQSGKVSEGIFNVCPHIESEDMKAMAAQMIKEVSDE